MNLFNSFQRKLAFLFSGIVLAISVFIYVYFPSQFEKEQIVAIRNKVDALVKITSFSIGAAINFNDLDALNEGVVPIVKDTNVVYLIVRNNLENVCYSNNLDKANRNNYKKTSISNSELKEMKIYKTKYNVVFNGEKVGTIYAGYSLEELNENIYLMRIKILYVSIIIFFVGIFATWGVGKLLTNPLMKLSETVHKIAGGDLNVRAEIISNDEIGKLAISFNEMTDKIISYNYELEKINSELEQRVEVRTRELKSAKEKAEESNRIKTVFFTNMSHELRTPLMGILGNAEMLALSSVNEKFKKMANNIALGGQRLLKTLNSILDISQLESGEDDFNFEKVDISECINKVAEQFQTSALKKNISLEFINRCNQTFIFTKKRYFNEILNNLVNNAVKFTNHGRVEISLSQNNQSVILEVEDTGIGIPLESQKVIFEEFRQVSEGFGRGFQGAGLGLAITKKFVLKLGGTISVNSTINVGSKFKVELPIIRNSNDNG